MMKKTVGIDREILMPSAIDKNIQLSLYLSALKPYVSLHFTLPRQWPGTALDARPISWNTSRCVGGHGDMLNGAIRKLVLSNIETRKSYAPDYHKQLRELVRKTNMPQAPGSIDELKHAVNARKQVLVLKKGKLEEIDSKDISQIEKSVVPFYPPSRHVYIKLWRDPVKNAYQEWCAKTTNSRFEALSKS